MSSASARRLVVDWEWEGKEARQAGSDTEINRHTQEDLRAARGATKGRVLCRINRVGEGTADEVKAAIEGGADELLVPMVRSVEEVERVLRAAGERCGVGIMVETEEAIACVKMLGKLPLSRVYLGLMDLAIERGHRPIFEAVRDGTVERVRGHFKVPFGFAGLTAPEGGSPVPCRLLIAEMCRLDCGFSFLRRSFYKDLRHHAVEVLIPNLHEALAAARARRPAMRVADHAELALRLQEVIAREGAHGRD